MLDALYFWWCCSALAATLAQLAARRQSAKLHLYRRFGHVLLGTVVLSALWIGWQMLFILQERAADEHWALLWTFDAFWHVLYFFVLGTICALWSPSKSHAQYAYMEELPAMEAEEAEGAEDDAGSATSRGA